MVLPVLRRHLQVKHKLGSAALAEFAGTFLLVLIGTSVVAQSVLPRPVLNEMININVGFGIAIAFGIAVSAKISGGHINPAVSLMFLTFRQLEPLAFIVYVIAQTAGAFLGAAVTYLVYCDAITAFDDGKRAVLGVKATAGIFASYPAVHLTLFNGFIDQIVAAAVFCFIIAHVVDKKNAYPSWLQPLLIGTAFVGIGAAFGYNCGYPVNPARDFGPRLFTLFTHGSDVFTKWALVPILGPFIGGPLGGWLYYLLVGFNTPQDVEEKYVVLTGNQELKPFSGPSQTEALLPSKVDETALTA